MELNKEEEPREVLQSPRSLEKSVNRKVLQPRGVTGLRAKEAGRVNCSSSNEPGRLSFVLAGKMILNKEVHVYKYYRGGDFSGQKYSYQ